MSRGEASAAAATATAKAIKAARVETHLAHGTVARHNALRSCQRPRSRAQEAACGSAAGVLGRRTFKDWVAGAAMVEVQCVSSSD